MRLWICSSSEDIESSSGDIESNGEANTHIVKPATHLVVSTGDNLNCRIHSLLYA